MYIPISKCVSLSANKPFKNVVHIGAHHGQEGQSYAQAGVESVVWVEACRRFMGNLFDNTKGLPLSQRYLNVCLSDVSGEEVQFNISNNGESSSMLEFGTHSTLHPQVSFVDKLSLVTQRFDELATSESIDTNLIDFINVDVQGAELKVLKGFGEILSKDNVRAVYTEVNFEHVYKDCCLITELDEYLATFNFKRVLTKGELKEWQDALYLKQY